MSLDAEITRAVLTAQTGPRQGKPLTVHFNPVSLEYSVSNTLDKGQGDKVKQFVSQTTGKLTMELVFDTTDDGADVRLETEKVAALMEPAEDRTPAIIEFEWGTYSFQGMLESYKETIDFFSPSGVPLRASINITLAAQDVVFQPGPDEQAAADEPDAVDVRPQGSAGVADTARDAGDPRGARDLAAANGEENLRFPSGDLLTVQSEVRLRPPVAFAGGGIGLGISGGIGLGISGGVGLGISGGIGLGGGFGAGGDGRAGGGSASSSGTGAAARGPTGGATAARGGFGMATGLAPELRAGHTQAVGRGAAAASTGGSAGLDGRAAVPSRSAGSAASPVVTPPPAASAAASAGVTARAGAFAGLRPPAAASRRARALSAERLRPRHDESLLSTDARATFEIGGRARNEGAMSLSADVDGGERRPGLRFDEE